MNNKRETLKKVAGVSAVVALAPTSWTKPIVNSVVLPVHAQTSNVECVNSIEFGLDETDPAFIQFGIDGNTCTLNNEASVKVTFIFVQPNQPSVEGDYDITVEDETGVVANFQFIALGFGVDNAFVNKVKLVDSTGRSWSGPLHIAVNNFVFEVNGQMNLES